MRTLHAPQLQAEAAQLEKMLVAAGAHQWTQECVEAHMRAEATKLRPSAWYYIARAIPLYSVENLADRIMIVLAGLLLAGALLTVGATAAMFFSLVFMGAMGFETLVTMAFAGLGVISATFCFAGTEVASIIHGPGRWQTHNFYPHLDANLATNEVMERVRNIQAMLPSARFEISVLYQDKWIRDPVLWLVLNQDGTKTRRAILVWDADGNIVLPH